MLTQGYAMLVLSGAWLNYYKRLARENGWEFNGRRGELMAPLPGGGEALFRVKTYQKYLNCFTEEEIKAVIKALGETSLFWHVYEAFEECGERRFSAVAYEEEIDWIVKISARGIIVESMMRCLPQLLAESALGGLDKT